MATPNRSGTDSPGGTSAAALLLGRQFKQMQTDKDIPGISCGLVGDSVFEWEIMLMLDEEQDSLYGGESAFLSAAVVL
jgi:ubiquitin-conjugating enzyme E2 G1